MCCWARELFLYNHRRNLMTCHTSRKISLSHNTKDTTRERPFNKKGNITFFPKRPRITKKYKQKQQNDRLIAYVLDTNVLKISWDSIFKFGKHYVYIISEVWRELDKNKTGRSRKAFNVRKAVSAIEKLTADKSSAELRAGIHLVPPNGKFNNKPHTGKLFLDFTKPKLPTLVDTELCLDAPDDRIIMVCITLMEKGHDVILVSNDNNCTVRANSAGVKTEKYHRGASAN